MAIDVRVEMLYYDLWLFSHFSASGQQILEEEEQRPLKREPMPMSTTKEAMTENPSLLSDGWIGN